MTHIYFAGHALALLYVQLGSLAEQRSLDELLPKTNILGWNCQGFFDIPNQVFYKEKPHKVDSVRPA